MYASPWKIDFDFAGSTVGVDPGLPVANDVMVVPSGRDVSPGSSSPAQTCIRIHNNPSCGYHFVALDIFS
jgi:hypothetical protein